MCAVWLCEILSLHSASNIQTWCNIQTVSEQIQAWGPIYRSGDTNLVQNEQLQAQHMIRPSCPAALKKSRGGGGAREKQGKKEEQIWIYPIKATMQRDNVSPSGLNIDDIIAQMQPINPSRD